MWLSTSLVGAVRRRGRPCDGQRMIRVKGDPLPKTSDVTRAEYEALLLRVKQLEVAVVARSVTQAVTVTERNGKSNAERQRAFRERRKANGKT